MSKALRFFCFGKRGEDPPAGNLGGVGQVVANEANNAHQQWHLPIPRRDEKPPTDVDGCGDQQVPVDRFYWYPQQREGKRTTGEYSGGAIGNGITVEKDLEQASSLVSKKDNISIDLAAWTSSVPGVGGDHRGKRPAASAQVHEEEYVIGADFGKTMGPLCDFCCEAKSPSQFYPVPAQGCEHSLCLDCFSMCALTIDGYGSAAVLCPVPYCPSGSFRLLSAHEAERLESDRQTDVWPNSGPSSSSPWSSAEIYCGICMENKPASEGFLDTRGCAHVFCQDCIAQYIAARVEESAVFRIPCPEPSCSTAGYLLPDDCRPILTQEVFDKWGAALCESSVAGEGGIYCPYSDCSALVLPAAAHGPAELVTEAQCPHCRRVLCVQCRSPWHKALTCAEFEECGRDSNEAAALVGLRKLAANKQWQRCPKCGFYVERVDGCVFIRCRCRHCFCYLCASPMKENDRKHYCSNCNCTWDAVRDKRVG